MFGDYKGTGMYVYLYPRTHLVVSEGQRWSRPRQLVRYGGKGRGRISVLYHTLASILKGHL